MFTFVDAKSLELQNCCEYLNYFHEISIFTINIRQNMKYKHKKKSTNDTCQQYILFFTATHHITKGSAHETITTPKKSSKFRRQCFSPLYILTFSSELKEELVFEGYPYLLDFLYFQTLFTLLRFAF